MNFPHYKVWRTPVTKGALPKPLPVCVCASKATAKLIAGVLDRLFLDKFTYTFENSECPNHLDLCLKLYVSPDGVHFQRAFTYGIDQPGEFFMAVRV